MGVPNPQAQSPYGQVCPELNIQSLKFTKADTEKKRDGESRRGEENRGAAKHCRPSCSRLCFCSTTLLPLCIQMYRTDRGCRLQLTLSCIRRRGTETPVWVKLPWSIPSLSPGQAELLSNSQSLSLAHCPLPTKQPCEHLCEHSSLIPQPHVFRLSPPLYFCLTRLSPSLPPPW